MFRGEYTLSLDAKGRMAVPAKYRKVLQEQYGGQLVVTKNFDLDARCLLLYPLAIWEQIENKLTEVPGLNKAGQRFKRFFVGNANDCDLDKSGRILLPATHREFSSLGKRLRLLGMVNKFEIWDEDLWQAQQQGGFDLTDEDGELPGILSQLPM